MELTATSHLLLAAFGILLVIVALDVRYRRNRRSSSVANEEKLEEAPGPHAWPLLGSLHLFGGYEVPYAAFTKLTERYGDIIKLHLGSQRCLVVNGISNIKEVLYNKGAEFDGRPNFARFQQLFCGDKENSLAFCDWSDVQKLRREMLRTHTFPRAFSARFLQLDSLLTVEMNDLITRLDGTAGQPIAIKPEILYACANVFTSYFCSKRFDRYDSEFNTAICNFDAIFYEVNQGNAADFLPWLMPFQSHHMTEMNSWSRAIRHFVEKHIINERLNERRAGNIDETGDYISALIDHVDGEEPRLLNWNTAMFALEDIIGGHSAVANLLIKILGFVATRPQVQQRIKEETDITTGNGSRQLCLADRTLMPYTDATVLEAIRLISSPIVPHVANKNSSVAGYKVEKGTLIFLNNYELNMSPKLWNEPENFCPDRFLDSGRLVKPEYFLPFGGGRRSCMGYKMVQFIAFATLGTLLQRYRIEPVDQIRVPLGDLALPPNTFRFRFVPHQHTQQK